MDSISNALNLDPDPEFWSYLAPDPGFEENNFNFFLFGEKQLSLKQSFFNFKKTVALEEIFGHLVSGW